jgi:hypothetical protein
VRERENLDGSPVKQPTFPQMFPFVKGKHANITMQDTVKPITEDIGLNLDSKRIKSCKTKGSKSIVIRDYGTAMM